MKIFFKRVAIICFIVLLYSTFIERYLLLTNENEIEYENLPPEFDGIKILVISDLHYGFLMPELWIKYIIHRANSYNPDIIVGVGDYVKKRNFSEELKVVWTYLNQLHAREGVYFVNGNHDHWANEPLALELLEKSSNSVRHKYKIISRGDKQIIVAGAGDFWEDELGIDKALMNVSSKTFTIVLAHNPDSADIVQNSHVDLFISGHTHGGQVILPFFGITPVIPVNNKNYNYGFKKNSQGTSIFISKGIGWSILPLRFNCFPELPVIILKRKKSFEQNSRAIPSFKINVFATL